MSIPFGIIFSIFLIIIFIIVAFYGINHFLSIGDCAKVGGFYTDLQKQVDNVWESQASDNNSFDINLPSGTEKVCFYNSSAPYTQNAKTDYSKIQNNDPEHNLFILPSGKACDMPSYEIKHIDLVKITAVRNPYCVDVSQQLKIKKDFYDKYVTIQ